MYRLMLITLFLLPVLASATPVTIEGSYLTAVADTPDLCPSGSASGDVSSDLLGTCQVLLDLLISPVGGTFLYATGQTYYNTVAGVTLDLLDAAGVSLGTLSLRGKSSGVNATSFSLQDSILVDFAPAAFALYFTGRDAQVDWKITIDNPSGVMLTAAAAPSIPEPMTLLTLAAGSGFLAVKRRSV